MRVYWSYDEQSSHVGYVDMCFKEIHDSPKSGQLIYDAGELFNLITEGYIYVGKNHSVPAWMAKLDDWDGDYKGAKISKRVIKKWCERVIGDDKEQLEKEWAIIEAELNAIDDNCQQNIERINF